MTDLEKPRLAIPFNWKRFAPTIILFFAIIVEDDKLATAGPLTLLILFGAASYCIGYVVFSPFSLRLETSSRTQFFIADIYVLIGQLALIALPLYKSTRWEIAVSATLLIFSWWWLGLRLLARNGILKASSRFSVLFKSIPEGYGVAPLLICVAIYKWSAVKDTLYEHVPSFVYPLNYILLVALVALWCGSLALSILESRGLILMAIMEENSGKS